MARSLCLGLLAVTHAMEDGSAAFYESVTGGAGAENATAYATFLKTYVESTGARCLDGSPAVFYHRKGMGDGCTLRLQPWTCLMVLILTCPEFEPSRGTARTSGTSTTKGADGASLGMTASAAPAAASARARRMGPPYRSKAATLTHLLRSTR